MTSLKTYLISDNGEYKIKEQRVKDKVILKNTLDDRKMKIKMAKLARMAKENNVKMPEVVNVEIVKKPEVQVPIHISQLPIQVSQIPVNYTEKVVKMSKIASPQLQQAQVAPPNIEGLMKDKCVVKEKSVMQDKSVIQEVDKIKKVSGKETKEEELQRELMVKICKIIGINGHPQGKMVSFDTLNDPHVIKELYGLQDLLKEVFPSSKLTALHSNAIDKQQFPGVNIVRQILKEMGYKMKPINISDGYLGTKKLLRREYQILKI